MGRYALPYVLLRRLNLAWKNTRVFADLVVIHGLTKGKSGDLQGGKTHLVLGCVPFFSGWEWIAGRTEHHGVEDCVENVEIAAVWIFLWL